MEYTILAGFDRYEARFRSLVDDQCLAFPCDARGVVELDALSERGRHRYFYARALIGHRFASPAVVSVKTCA